MIDKPKKVNRDGIDYIDGKVVIHQSTISAMLNCGEQVRLGNIIKSRTDLVGFKSEALHYGTRFHRSVESHFRAILDGYDISIDDIINGLRRTWLVYEDKVPIQWKADPNSLLLGCEKLIRKYFEWYGEQTPIVPIAVEKNILLETEYAWLEGTLDLTTSTGIIDWKTASTYTNGKEAADSGLQWMFYPLLESGCDIKAATDISFNYHIAVKSNYQIFSLLKYPKVPDLEVLLYRTIPNVAKMIVNKIYIPNFSFKWCRSDMCAVWDACRGGMLKL